MLCVDYTSTPLQVVTGWLMPRLWSNQGDLHCRPQARRQRRPLCWQTLQRSQSRRQPAKPWKPAPPIRKLWRLLRQAQTHPAPAFSQLSPLQHQSRAPPARQVGCRGMSRAPTLHAKKWQAFGFDEVWSCMLFSAMCIRAPRTLCLCFYWLPRQYIMHATDHRLPTALSRLGVGLSAGCGNLSARFGWSNQGVDMWYLPPGPLACEICSGWEGNDLGIHCRWHGR